jgi:hypothetical protein
MRQIETKEDLVACFERLGWKTGRGEVGDRYGLLRIGDKILEPYLSRRNLNFPFEIGGWITEDAISAISTLMNCNNKRFSESCPVENSPNYKIDKPVVYEDDVAEISDAYIKWGRNYDMVAGLKALRDLPTDCIGAMPARHLAALAAYGDVDTLAQYLNSFAQGDRLGFVPYITTDYIKTALDFAEHRRADPRWLPKKPKMRV